MVSALQVNELRKITGAGMMECKNALVEAAGNSDKAVDILRKKGISKAAKKSNRETAEGAVFIEKTNQKAAIVLIGCETDFVAKNENFQKFGKEIATLAVEKGEQSALQQAEKQIKNLIGTIGENMKVLDIKILESNIIGSYTHTNGKIGVLVGLKEGEETVASDVAMHAAAMNPNVLSPEEVEDSLVAKEREIWIEQLKNAGKPENIIENILKGKEKKFRGENALLTQSFVKNPSETVAEFLKSKNSQITQFIRLAI